MIWFPFYSSDFIGATIGLSCQEVSIYNWMLTLYYELGPFPTDPVRVYRIVRCESDEQKRTVDYLLQTFFVLREDGWYQPRAEKEKVIVAQNSQRARDKANKRWHGAPHDAAALPQHSDSIAPAMPTTTTTTTTSKTTEDKDIKDMSTTVVVDAPQRSVSGKTYVVPDCPYQQLIDLYHEVLPTLPRVEVLSDGRKRHLKARWRQSCADDHYDAEQALDWWRWFFGKVAKSKFLTGKTKSKDGRSFTATLDFLIDPEKFVRIYEGKYD